MKDPTTRRSRLVRNITEVKIKCFFFFFFFLNVTTTTSLNKEQYVKEQGTFSVGLLLSVRVVSCTVCLVWIFTNVIFAGALDSSHSQIWPEWTRF